MRRLLIPLLAGAALLSGAAPGPGVRDVIDRNGCVVRHNADEAVIHWIFAADSMFEGGPAVLDALDRAGIKGSFFFTGNFLRDSANRAIVERAVRSGHYVGGHSDRHLLLCDWDYRRTPLVSADSMRRDLYANARELSRHGVDTASARYVLPPFEWCSAFHSGVYRREGYTPVNISPGIMIYRDYTTPGMEDYWSSDSIIDQLLDYERRRGLNGTFLIMHAGTQDLRTDKLYRRLPWLIDTLGRLGYRFERLR